MRRWLVSVMFVVVVSLCHRYHDFPMQGLSILGSKSEVNPDGSTKEIAFCDMGEFFVVEVDLKSGLLQVAETRLSSSQYDLFI
jgi:hypothetical protein